MEYQEIVENAMRTFFYGEVLNTVLYGVLILFAIALSIAVYKLDILKSRVKAVLLIIFVLALSLGLIAMRAIEFIPVYNDYKNMSYTVVEDAEVYINEGTNNLLEGKNEVDLKTSVGEEIKLRITNGKFETEVWLKGMVVYSNNSKHIILFSLK